MKVKDLIAQLENENPEAEVMTYIGEADEYGKILEVKSYKKDDKDELPYAGGDYPKIKTELVLIQGWII